MDTIKYTEGMVLEKGELYETKDGVYRLLDNKLCKAITKIKDMEDDVELDEELQEIRIPKIPYDKYKEIHSFFKHIYTKHKSEVAVLLWYNFERKDWIIEVPKQTVTGASVRYDRDESYTDDLTNKGYLCVGSIHSHCEMSAFHSGTDDADEYNFDGIHITLGKVISGVQQACRFIVKEQAYKMKFSNCVDLPFDEAQPFPEEWDKQVSKPIYTKAIDWYKKKGLQTQLPLADNDEFLEEVVNPEEEEEDEFDSEFDKCPICYKDIIKNEEQKCSYCEFDYTGTVEEYFENLEAK